MSALYDALGIDATDGIDATELELIKKAIAAIRVEAARVAEKHDDSNDTMVILQALTLQVKAFRNEITPEDARKIINAHATGEKISFGNGVANAELAAKAAEAEELQRKLEELQATAAATTPTTKALSGSGTDPETLKAKFAQIVDANPDGAAQVLQIVEQFANVPEDERTVRSVLALKIVNGVD